MEPMTFPTEPLRYWDFVLNEMPHNLQRCYLLCGIWYLRELAARIGKKETYLRSKLSRGGTVPLDIALLMAEKSGGLMTVEGLNQPCRLPKKRLMPPDIKKSMPKKGCLVA